MDSSYPSEELLEKIASKLTEWWKKEGRHFLWRMTNDPYRLLVTEILLQKTRAEAVEEVYEEFFSKYPDIFSLAAAKPEDLEKIIGVLGLRYRASRLIQIANKIVKEFGGVIPSRFEELLELPGVGVYIANALLNFAYGIPRPVIDVNVMRVLNRLFNVTSEKQGWRILENLFLKGDNRVIGYALIDLASLICRWKPNCKSCPLDEFCPKYPLRRNDWRFFRKTRRRKEWKISEQPSSRKKSS